jgi:heme oxygenase
MIDPWSELERLPVAMADAVKPHLTATTREGYRRFLAAMIDYTRGSGERLRHAAARAPSPALATFFDRLAREEAGHYRLAEADLAALDPSSSHASSGGMPAEVAAFHRFWMESEDPATWLGALYVLESVGGHLGEAAAKNLARLGLGRDQVRFVMVHLEADTEHGASTAEHARRCLDEDGAGGRMIEAARYAAAFWIGLHVRAFSDDVSPSAP